MAKMIYGGAKLPAVRACLQRGDEARAVKFMMDDLTGGKAVSFGDMPIEGSLKARPNGVEYEVAEDEEDLAEDSNMADLYACVSDLNIELMAVEELLKSYGMFTDKTLAEARHRVRTSLLEREPINGGPDNADTPGIEAS